MAGLEGSPYSRLSQMMGKFGYNKAVDFEIGTVISPEPNLIVKMDSSPIELDRDDLLIAEHLTNHKRYMTIRKSKNPEWQSNIRLKSTDVGDSETVVSSHSHDLTMVDMKNVQDDFTFEQVEVEYLDGLKAGDRVIMAWLDEQMRAVVFDRANFR